MLNYYLVLLFLIKVLFNRILGYEGENFPQKYVNTDGLTPTEDDFNHYLFHLEKSVNFVHQKPNNSDVNRALGLYFMKETEMGIPLKKGVMTSIGVLGRTLVDYSHKLKKFQQDLIVDLIKKARNILSHYIYEYKHVHKSGPNSLSDMFKDDTFMVHTMETFNKNKLKKYLKSEDDINQYVKDFDDLSLPKEIYVMLVMMKLNKYYISAETSDKCISRVMKTAEPIYLHKWQPCGPDPFCKKSISKDPSIAYNLSHRIVNLLLYRLTRQCYWESPAADAAHIDRLCAHMYREAVYIARRGYFSRDLFLEHIALCSLMGYEEFHRRNWFYKVTSWQDKHGCIQEFDNFEVNRTAVMLINNRDQPLKAKRIKRNRRQVYLDLCHNHQMALLKVVLAHGMRHAAHYMTPLV